MRRFKLAALPAVASLLLLSGCWDLQDLQEVNYMTAMGFDLKDDEIVVYAQMLNFTSVAKVEEGGTGPAPVWVGIGRGGTVTNAIEDLYRTSQLRIFYGHINAIVLGEDLMLDEMKLREAYEFVSRYYEMRYTAWIFGTSRPVDELLAVTPLFNLSPGVSILHQPYETYRQNSTIRPISVREFNLDLQEPGRTTLLPSLTMNDDNWRTGGKPSTMLEFNGAYLFKDTQYRGWIAERAVKGLPWVEPMTARAPVTIYDGEAFQASLVLEKPNVDIQPRMRDGRAEYTMRVTLTGNIVEVMEALPESTIERKTEEKVRKQIRETFEEGLKMNVDLLQLEQALYRKNNRDWKALRERGEAAPTAESLKEIQVSVHLMRTGKVKHRRIPR